MRFTDTDGSIIDVYQAATQMTDESDQSYPLTPNRLLDNATGPLGYYGAFVANGPSDVLLTAAPLSGYGDGKRAVLVCQNAGLLLSANALAGYAHHHQLPFLVLAVYRGSYEDRFYYQMYKGQVTEPVLEALRIPFHIVDRIEDVAIVEEAVREATLARKPVVVLLRRAALLGDAKGS